jgi:predicted peptidase
MIKETTYSVPRTGTVDFGCLITVPTGFDPKKEQLPLIVFLHGAGERGSDISRVRVHGVAKLFYADPDWHGLRVITLSPQCPANTTWNQLAPEVMQLIARVCNDYNVDRDRVSLTGLSMGGFGTWELGMQHPEVFSALAPICGGAMSWRVGALKDIPMRVFHGEADPVVPVQNSIEAVEMLRREGGNPELTIYPGVQHDSWTYTYEQTDLIEWLAVQKRK